MKFIYLKIAFLFSFLTIFIPFGKLTIPNGGILLITILQIFDNSPKKGFNINIDLQVFIAILTLISLVFVFLKNKILIFLSIIIQYFWLLKLIKLNSFNDLFFLITVITYVILTIVFLFVMIYKKSKEEI